MTPSRGNKALWHCADGPTNRGVSGLLVAKRISPFRNPASIVERIPTLWQNPWCARPIGRLLWASRRFGQHTGDVIDEPGVPPSELFGIPSGWFDEPNPPAWMTATVGGAA